MRNDVKYKIDFVIDLFEKLNSRLGLNSKQFND